MRHALTLSLIAAGLYSCSENTFFKDPEIVEGLSPGTILGRVCDPSGRHWLPDAMVYSNLIDDSGKLYDTRISYTDRDGYFLLDPMPAGSTYTVYVQYGDAILETHEVEVDDGEEVVPEEPTASIRSSWTWRSSPVTTTTSRTSSSTWASRTTSSSMAWKATRWPAS